MYTLLNAHDHPLWMPGGTETSLQRPGSTPGTLQALKHHFVADTGVYEWARISPPVTRPSSTGIWGATAIRGIGAA